MAQVQQPAEESIEVFPIFELPMVPLIHALTFLDEKSVRQCRLASPLFCCTIANNKMKMAANEVHRVTFRRIWNRLSSPTLGDAQVFIQVTIKKTIQSTPFVIYFPSEINEQGVLDSLAGADIYDIDIDEHNTFHDWIAAKFFNIHIDILELDRICFTLGEIEYLQDAFVRHKVSAKELHLRNTIYEKPHVDILLRLALIFHPSRFEVYEEEPEIVRHMLTPMFLSHMSSLQYFRSRSGNQLAEAVEWTQTTVVPHTIFKFPPIFVMGPGLLLSITNVKKGLEEWSKNRLPIVQWTVILPVAYLDEDRFLLELGLAYEVQETGSFCLKNSADQQLYARVCEPVEWTNQRISCWHIAVKDLDN